jgi:hypothetical protein
MPNHPEMGSGKEGIPSAVKIHDYTILYCVFRMKPKPLEIQQV